MATLTVTPKVNRSEMLFDIFFSSRFLVGQLAELIRIYFTVFNTSALKTPLDRVFCVISQFNSRNQYFSW